MPSVDLSSYKVAGAEVSDATKFDNLVQAIQNALNGLDASNWAAGQLFAPSKFTQEGAADGQALLWSTAQSKWIPSAPPGGAPSGAAGGSLTGTYPNPTIANLAVTNAMVSASAAIVASKLAGYPSDPTKALLGDGTWGTVSGSGGELDFNTKTSNSTTTATTQGSASTVINGNSLAYDTSNKLIVCSLPNVSCTGGTTTITFVLLRGATFIGQFLYDATANGAGLPMTLTWNDRAPTAGTYSYKLQFFIGGAGPTGLVSAGNGGSGNLTPITIRVSKA